MIRRTWHFTPRAHRLMIGVMMIAAIVIGFVWPYVLIAN